MTNIDKVELKSDRLFSAKEKSQITFHKKCIKNNNWKKLKLTFIKTKPIYLKINIGNEYPFFQIYFTVYIKIFWYNKKTTIKKHF